MSQSAEPTPDTKNLPYRQNVLGIKTTVAVSLASKRLPISRIVNLVPGSIIQFDKTWDSPLVLEVGGLPFATGKTVKIGDKFGLKLESIGIEEEPHSGSK